MHVRSSISALALAVAAPALAQSGSVQDFQLPPDPESTATPQVQGPVDPDAPVPTTPRAIPTAQPTSRPTAQPTPAPTIPLELPRQPQPTPTAPSTQRTAPAPRATPTTQQTVQSETDEPVTQATADDAQAQATSTAGGLGFDLDAAPPATLPSAAAPAQEGGGSLIPWLAALVAVLAAAGAGYWFLRRREELTPVPVIEPPLARQVQPRPQPAPAPPSPSQPASAPVRENVSLAAQPVRFSRSMMNATFAYRVVLENRSGEPWEDLAIEADLVTAHNAAPIAEQLADPAAPLAPMGRVAALAPGETVEVKGDVRLPLQQVRAIRQGSAAVYVPLLRLRVAAKGRAPMARTFLVGQLPQRQGGNLQPFRLDEMPQSYSAIGMRPLD